MDFDGVGGVKMAVFWVVTSCSLVEVYHRSRALMLEAENTYETLANFYLTTRRYNPEDKKTAIFTLTIVRTSNPTCWWCVLH
jgi:hypothetical protein